MADFDFILFQFSEFPQFFKDIDPELVIFQTKCLKALGRNVEAKKNFETVFNNLKKVKKQIIQFKI